MYSATALTSGTITFTFTFGATGFIEGNLYDIFGASMAGSTHSNGAANSQPMQVSAFTAQFLTLANYLCDGCTGTNTAGSGYTLVSGQPVYPSNGFWGIGENSNSVSGNNEQCKITQSASIGFAGTCLSFTGSLPVTSFVIPCTFFQLQCWLFPIFYMALFLTVPMAAAAALRASYKAMFYVLLSCSTFFSVLEIMLGIMTIMVPLFLIVVNVLYSFRLFDRALGAIRR